MPADPLVEAVANRIRRRWAKSESIPPPHFISRMAEVEVEFVRRYRAWRDRARTSGATAPPEHGQHGRWPDKAFVVDGGRARARNAVQQAIAWGLLPRQEDTPCAGCGGVADVYHHHAGYEPEHWLDVVALCHRCHVGAHSPPVDVQGAAELAMEETLPARDTRWRRSAEDGRVRWWLRLDGEPTRFFTLVGIRRFEGDWPWALYEHRPCPSWATEVWWHRQVKGCATRKQLEAWVKSAAARGDLDQPRPVRVSGGAPADEGPPAGAHRGAPLVE